MKIKLLYFGFLFLALNVSSSSIAQHIHTEQCGFTHILEQREKKFPGYTDAVAKTHQHALTNYAAFAARQSKTDTTYRIPVVVHVVYNPNDPLANLSDELIKEQIRVLNEDFNRLNSDTGNIREQYKDRAGSMSIEFFLAEKDPEGNPTTGINRVETSRTTFLVLPGDDLEIVKRSSQGGVDSWDTRRYLNIWTCNLSLFGSDFLLGFAYPPVGAQFWPADIFPDAAYEGVVMNYKVFGPNNPASAGPLSSYNLGRTLTHEVGHYLGLRHIWGDGDCLLDDGLQDTPNQDQSSPDCLIERNSCAPEETPDLYENYMDYSGDACMNMFTKQQANLMVFNLVENRPDLAEVRITGSKDFEVSIYPVPASQNLTISVNTISSGPARVRIYNLIGQLVEDRTVSIDNFTEINLDVSHLTVGSYFMQLSFAGFEQKEKFLITR